MAVWGRVAQAEGGVTEKALKAEEQGERVAGVQCARRWVKGADTWKGARAYIIWSFIVSCKECGIYSEAIEGL